MWNDIATTISAEFADVPNASRITQIVVRLLVAAVLGGMLGFEREHRKKSAGIRTHMLVAIGAALFVLVPQQSGMAPTDLSRILQGLVAGIGFLGAGTIVKGESEENVKGLTTAAGLWLTAAIGVAAGLGRETTAVLSTIFALVILSILPKISDRLFPQKTK